MVIKRELLSELTNASLQEREGGFRVEWGSGLPTLNHLLPHSSSIGTCGDLGCRRPGSECTWAWEVHGSSVVGLGLCNDGRFISVNPKPKPNPKPETQALSLKAVQGGRLEPAHQTLSP